MSKIVKSYKIKLSKWKNPIVKERKDKRWLASKKITYYEGKIHKWLERYNLKKR